MRDVSELTGFPEMMDGRVKTLHPKVHGGLLALRDDAEHAAAMEEHGIAPIDLVVVNLYPFEATVAKGAAFDDASRTSTSAGRMIRAAAKNHDDVAVVVDAEDYARVLDELKHKAARRPRAAQARWRRRPMRAPPPTMRRSPTGSRTSLAKPRPRYRAFGGKLAAAAALRREPAPERRVLSRARAAPGVATARQVQGKELCYNNLNDTDAAFECVAEFDPDARRPA